MPYVRVDSLSIDTIQLKDLIDFINQSIQQRQGAWIATVNLEYLRTASNDPEFSRLIDTATVRVADGMPVVWAMRALGSGKVQKLSGADLVWDLAKNARTEGHRIFVLGGKGYAAREASTRLKKLGIEVAGWHSPPFGFEKSPAEVEKIAGMLSATTPDIVYVGLGSPKQDFLISNLRDSYPAAVYLGCGVAVEQVAKYVPRAPLLMQKTGTEWLFRLVIEPRKLARRYLLDGIPYLFRLAYKIGKQRLDRTNRASIS